MKDMGQFDMVFDGIDRTDVEYENGWWETSTGAEFGAQKKREILAVHEAAVSKVEIEAVDKQLDGFQGDGAVTAAISIATADLIEQLVGSDGVPDRQEFDEFIDANDVEDIQIVAQNQLRAELRKAAQELRGGKETPDRLERLALLCKGSVSVTYNEHASNYESVKQYLRRSIENPGGSWEEEKPADLNQMIKDNTVVEVQFYPQTPIGSYALYGRSLDKLLNEAIEIAEKERMNNVTDRPQR